MHKLLAFNNKADLAGCRIVTLDGCKRFVILPDRQQV